MKYSSSTNAAGRYVNSILGNLNINEIFGQKSGQNSYQGEGNLLYTGCHDMSNYMYRFAEV